MKIFLFVLAAFLIILSSCEKDDCVAGDLDTVIVGTWDVHVHNMNTGEVEFLDNGDLIDVDDTLIGGGTAGQPYNIKTYVVHSDNLITIRAEGAAGGSIEYDIDITSHECDKIEFDFLGIPGAFNRD